MIVLLVALAFCKELVVTVLWARAVAPGPYGPGVVAAPHKGAPLHYILHIRRGLRFGPSPNGYFGLGGPFPPTPHCSMAALGSVLYWTTSHTLGRDLGAVGASAPGGD